MSFKVKGQGHGETLGCMVMLCFVQALVMIPIQAKQKYRGMFETPKSGKRQVQERSIGLNIRTLESPKVDQDQVSGGVSVLCWHAAPVANIKFEGDLLSSVPVHVGISTKLSNMKGTNLGQKKNMSVSSDPTDPNFLLRP